MPAETAGLIHNLDLRLTSRNLPPGVEGQLNQTFLCGGKKVRPALCFLMGSTMGLSPERLAPYARAAELTHMASIAHDDVIDQSDRRRNAPTLNASTSNAEAVLAGDLLLARVMVEISRLGNLDIIHDLSSAVEDLVTGELLQLENRGKLDVPFSLLERISVLKTGSLMSWCCVVSARILDRGPELIEASRKFGETLGVAFQMVDDILDFETTSEKPFAQDLREGLVNFVASEMLIQNPHMSTGIALILGQPGSSVLPWTDEQLDRAKNEIRIKAALKLEQARTLLTEIQILSGAQGEASDRSREVLLSVLDFLGSRFV